jgi:hypothetical protein
MINIPLNEVRQHFAQSFRLDMRSVSDQELKLFCWIDGPIERERWKDMPNLHRLLTGREP